LGNAKIRKRVAIYKRVSTRGQAKDGYSLDAQERVLKAHCDAMSWILVKVYSDEGISGSTIKDRPGFMKMISDSKQGEFDIILVWNLTRFSRNLLDILTVCTKLEKRKIYLVSCSEGFECSTASGRMVRNIIGATGQHSIEVISGDIALGLLERAQQGRPMSSVLGYDKDKVKDMYVINPTEARIVRFIFKTYQQCKSLTATAKMCADKGYTGKRGNLLVGSNTIFCLLTTAVLAGYIEHQGNLYKGLHQPIIPPREFNNVQRMLLKQNRNVGRKRTKPLTIIPL
jgi:Site-specific recombinases, DNA invertase Pin homologs